MKYEEINKFEFLWISLFLFLAVFHIILVAYSLALEGPHIATRVERAKPDELLTGEGLFANPSVTYFSKPDRAEIVAVAQAFNFTPNNIVLEKGMKNTFYITSRDVIHGYQIENTNINAEVIPGEVATFNYTFTKSGKYRLTCNQYCGIGHQNMVAYITVVDDLEAYQAEQQAAAAPATSTPQVSGSSSNAGDNNTTETTSTEVAPTETAVASGSVPSNWQAIGEKTFNTNCASCHQATGQGIPGAFPPLAGHTPELVQAAEGRTYMLDVLLNGLQGNIEVHGQNYNGIMAAWQQLSDEELASVLNHVLTAWGNDADLPADFALYGTDDIAGARANKLSTSEVYDLRSKLGL